MKRVWIPRIVCICFRNQMSMNWFFSILYEIFNSNFLNGLSIKKKKNYVSTNWKKATTSVPIYSMCYLNSIIKIVINSRDAFIRMIRAYFRTNGIIGTLQWIRRMMKRIPVRNKSAFEIDSNKNETCLEHTKRTWKNQPYTCIWNRLSKLPPFINRT